MVEEKTIWVVDDICFNSKEKAEEHERNKPISDAFNIILSYYRSCLNDRGSFDTSDVIELKKWIIKHREVLLSVINRKL